MPVAKITKKQYDPILSLNQILPKILQTPSGLALLEIQGSINIGNKTLSSAGGLGLGNVEGEDEDSEMKNTLDDENEEDQSYDQMHHIGEFDFSDVEAGGSEVTLRIGRFQRLRGKLVKLKFPLAVLRVDPNEDSAAAATQESLAEKRATIGENRDAIVEIPILDIIYHKIHFSTRPEPIVYG